MVDRKHILLTLYAFQSPSTIAGPGRTLRNSVAENEHMFAPQLQVNGILIESMVNAV
jgi:hypothetical protein